MVRPILALYAGGMGAKGANFHSRCSPGWATSDVADRVQELYLQGKKAEAAAAIPLAMVGGRRARRPARQDPRRARPWRETCITEFLVSGPAAALPSFAELILG